MSEAAPLSERLLRQGRAWLAGHRLLAGGVLLAVAVAIWLGSGFYTVDNGSSAALRRFGRLIDDAVAPGLHLRLAGIDTVTTARTGDVFRLAVEGDRGPALEMLSGDENLIEARLVVQYRISELGGFLFSSAIPEELVRQAVRTALVESVATTSVEEVLTSAKASIQNEVRRRAQLVLERYSCGVTLVSVNLQSVDPPTEAAEAFRRVNDARAEAAEAVNKAHGRRGRQLRLARGQAGQLVAAAKAAAEVRRQQARGAAERFNELLSHGRRAATQTRDELLYTTVQRVLPRARVVLLPAGQGPQRIDIHLLPADRNVDPGAAIRELLEFEPDPEDGGS